MCIVKSVFNMTGNWFPVSEVSEVVVPLCISNGMGENCARGSSALGIVSLFNFSRLDGCTRLSCGFSLHFPADLGCRACSHVCIDH